MRNSMSIVVAILILPLFLSPQAAPKTYADPGGAFALLIPNHWNAKRIQMNEETWITELSPADATQSRIELIVVPWEEGLAPDRLNEIGQDMMETAIGLINANGAVQSQKVSRANLAGRAAVRCDLVYSDNTESTPRKGFMIVTLGRRNAILALVSASQADASGLNQAEGFLFTLAVESAQPASLQAKTDSPTPAKPERATFFTAASLSRTATRIKASLKREPAETVLVAGNPALTYDSVANFVRVVSFCFDIEFTETEFDLTRQRFIEYYNKSDAQGKTQIALGGASLWAGLQQGTPEQKAQNKQEVKTVMAQRFASGAQAGIEWAQALNDAIQRRTRSLSSTQAEVPSQYQQSQLDNQMTEADLNAAIEMLYFMWVASGRDPNLVTAEAMAQVRQYLALNFAGFNPTVQYLLANAEKLYAGVRMTWQAAHPNQRVLLVQQYNQALNEMGFGSGRQEGGGAGGSAWDDVAGKDASTIKAELAMSYAGSAATSTSFSGRKLTW